MASRDDNVMIRVLRELNGQRVKLFLRGGESFTGTLTVDDDDAEIVRVQVSNAAIAIRIAAVDAVVPNSAPPSARVIV
jgi:hypothetical protein